MIDNRHNPDFSDRLTVEHGGPVRWRAELYQRQALPAWSVCVYDVRTAGLNHKPFALDADLGSGLFQNQFGVWTKDLRADGDGQKFRIAVWFAGPDRYYQAICTPAEPANVNALARWSTNGQLPEALTVFYSL